MEPEETIAADDGFHVVIINGRIVFADSIPVRPAFIITDDCVLVGKGDSVIRNKGSQKKCVGSSAFRAPDPADPKEGSAFRAEDPPDIVCMDGQAGGMPTGAHQKVEL